MKRNPMDFMPAYFTVAFVWFTTHFGGGFASGRQLVEFFVQYGWYALFTPVIAIAINALVFYYAWDFSVAHQKFQYRSWTDAFYKPYERVFSNLYDVVFNLVLVVATAVAFATGGATLADVLGTPYLLNTLVIAIIMFILTIYGANIVRAAASWIAVIVITGLLFIYGSNLVVTLPNLMTVLNEAPAPRGFWYALWQSIKYAGLQAALLGGYVAVTDVLKNKQDVKRAAICGFILNAGIMVLASAVVLSYYPTIISEAVPVVFIIRNGFGGVALELLVSLLIFLGVISTGVNLIYGGSKRIVSVWAKPEEGEKSIKNKRIIASGIYVFITWSIALMGLIPLVAIGYSYVAYLALPIVVIPVLYKGITKRGGEKGKSNELDAMTAADGPKA
ncbi:Uncharacterized membrane protein [Alkaliphilus metalliredigens QYMF]|uniref:Uncharacterized membrane protein n=1 Tax=Alkaliphilus metalliredigens (strain QYMF) TaxID=293826 RepID=A6TKP8_ALKMQ|nr:hypothetical protein [Alkaliphilus metalliredigens]ABR46766.1 Uncharacterized membrane protein [Alkaliphilus metalliredigens QYMF]